MGSELVVSSVISVLVGALGIWLGRRIAVDKKVTWIAGFVPGKYDNEKLCAIVGNNIRVLGSLHIVYAIVYFVSYEYLKGTSIYTVLQVVTLVVILINIEYRTMKYAKIK